MEKTLIANPIYDVVFRYLMEDNKVAKLFLSVIIGEEIEELVFSPTESSRKIGERSITVTRMDFSAKIRQADGSQKLILIELQKSKYLFQIMRFRRYLGKQYQNPENVIISKNENGKNIKEGLPIYPIYILGEAFTEEVYPVINIERNYIDAATKERILAKYSFIESLTHDATTIQIPHLKERRRTLLEKFLEIFDQTNKTDGNGHFLEIDESEYPEKYHSVIRRLKKAIANPKIEADMDLEDDVVEEFNQQEKRLEKAEKLLEEKDEELEIERQKAEAATRDKEAIIHNLAKMGLSIEDIAKAANTTVEAVKVILQSEV
jgi:hypothetical protein